MNFIGVWPINLFVKYMLLLFLFLEKVHGPTPLIFLVILLSTSAQDDLGMRSSRCTYNFLGIPGSLNWNALDVPWFPQLDFLES